MNSDHSWSAIKRLPEFQEKGQFLEEFSINLKGRNNDGSGSVEISGVDKSKQTQKKEIF